MGASMGTQQGLVHPVGSPTSQPPAFLWIQAPPESHDGLNAQISAY